VFELFRVQGVRYNTLVPLTPDRGVDHRIELWRVDGPNFSDRELLLLSLLRPHLAELDVSVRGRRPNAPLTAQVEDIVGRLRRLNPFGGHLAGQSVLNEPDNYDPATGRQRVVEAFVVANKRCALLTRGPGGASTGAPKLSQRERELLTLVAQGSTDAQIAQQLFISIRTVRSHLDRIRDKTGCRRRADLTRLALDANVV